MVIPSFTQTANAQSCGDPGINCDDDGNVIVDLGPIGVIGDPIDDPWDWPDTPPWPGQGGNYPPGCDEYGCEGDDSGGNGPDPVSCSVSNRSELRERKANTPGCTGRPGPQFRTDIWRNNEGLTTWEWLNIPLGILYYGVWSNADFALDVLALTLISNNSDMNAAYPIFSRVLYDTSYESFPNDMDNANFNQCVRNAYFLLENYPTNQSMPTVFANWLLGTNFDVTDYASSWAGKFTRDVTNYQICKDVYSEWDDNDCSGPL